MTQNKDFLSKRAITGAHKEIIYKLKGVQGVVDHKTRWHYKFIKQKGSYALALGSRF